MHKIAIEILTDSCFKVPILKFSKMNTFVTGEKYDLRIKLKNFDVAQFPGDVFDVRIVWANQLQFHGCSRSMLQSQKKRKL